MAPEPVAPVLDGRYELGPMIGQGAMGEVHRGWDRRLERTVAIKCLRRDFAADDGVRQRFEEEARAAGGLAHHNIVTVFDSGESDGVPYIVMECLPGRTLEDELAKGPVDAHHVALMGAELAGALAAAHAAGVLHRDVKPANVLLDEHGSVKLADFGIAKSTEAASRITGTGTIIGSPAYLAPERLVGEPATAATDLYSLGVMLYEAAAGERPFRGETAIAIAQDIRSRTPPPLVERLPHLDPRMARAIDDAMARDPAARPASAAELAARLRAAAAPATATATADATISDPAGGTQVLPVSVTSTTVVDPVPAAVELHHSGAGARRLPAWVLAAAVAVALVLGIGYLVAGEDGGDLEPPTTGTEVTTPTAGATLPEPIDDALRELEESVDP